MIGGSNIAKKFYFLGSSREEGLLGDHPFGNLVSGIRNFDVCVTMVELHCMVKEATNTIISELLCLSPRLTRNLSEIVHHKTKGQ